MPTRIASGGFPRSAGEHGAGNPRVGAGLVPARWGDPEDTEAPGESVRPGVIQEGGAPLGRFHYGGSREGKKSQSSPSRVSFLFASFSLDKQRERTSVPPRIRRSASRNQGHTARATARAKRSGGRPYGLNGTFLNKFRTPNSELRIALRAAEGVGPYGVT